MTARLEALRGWGNLEVSASVGQVGTVEDYYRRRNRYLITRVGQEVHDVVEGVLSQVDDVRDVSLGRLDQLREGLSALAALDAASAPPGRLAEAVRAVFDPHVAFSAEITQFFAAINQWQSRFDLDEDEFAFFSEVLVGYVGERLEALRRRARPVGALLETVLPRVPVIVDRAADGLAARVAAAGLSSVRVRREPGAVEADWENLASWFLGAPGRPSRIQVLERDAVDAVRTLTQNLTRLSRSGTAGASRRADYLRLALFFDRSDPASVHEIAAAAFGLAGRASPRGRRRRRHRPRGRRGVVVGRADRAGAGQPARARRHHQPRAHQPRPGPQPGASPPARRRGGGREARPPPPAPSWSRRGPRGSPRASPSPPCASSSACSPGPSPTSARPCLRAPRAP